MFNILFPLWMLAAPLLSFGGIADKELAQLDFFFAVRVRAWLLLVRVLLGLSVLVTSGRRSHAQQLAQHLADRRNPAPNPARPDVHMRGVALDVNFMRGGLIVLRKADSPVEWAKVYALADLCGISNGSRFNGYPDNNHFFDTLRRSA